MNIKQKKKILNLTRILSEQTSDVTFKVTQNDNALFLWADNIDARWFDKTYMFHAVIGVKGGVKVLTKRGFYL